MNRTLWTLAMCVAAPLAGAAGSAAADDKARAQQIIRSTAQVSTPGPEDYFTGQVRVDPLFPASEEINASGAYVTFEPGARSAWHTHPAGQRLVVVSGVGLT